MKIDDILLSLDPNIKKCDRCKRWFNIKIMGSIYYKLMFNNTSENVPCTCIICGWSNSECRQNLLIHNIDCKDLEKAFCYLYCITYHKDDGYKFQLKKGKDK